MDNAARGSNENFIQFTLGLETSDSVAPPCVPNEANETINLLFAGDIGSRNNGNEIYDDASYSTYDSGKKFHRSSSLRVPKEYATGSTTAQKKIVRFADVLGLDLANVRTFMDELPSVPKSVFDDLDENNTEVELSPSFCGDRTCGPSASCKSLYPAFKLPVESSDFVDRIRRNYVCLEKVCVQETPVCHIIGQIIVRNLDFFKSVYVRYTFDEWRTYAEAQATYTPHNHDSPDSYDLGYEFYDKFVFVLYIYDTVAVGKRIELAIRYHCLDSVYWDNNDGHNYVFQRFPVTTSYLSSASPSLCVENFQSFY